MDVSASYHKPSDRDMLSKRIKFNFQHRRSPYDPPEDLSRGSQVQRDEQTFLELQRYADFQNVLSKRLCDDIEKDDIYSSIDPLLLTDNDTLSGYLPDQTYIHPALQNPIQRPMLSLPVIIPERKTTDGARGWIRAYAPSLMECGIDQNTFLRFIDMFNETVKGLPTIDVLNVSEPDHTVSEGMIMDLIHPTSFALPSRAATSRPEHPSFLRLANDQLFNPHGLNALVVNAAPDQELNASATEPTQSYSETTSQQIHLPYLQSAAPLIILEDEIRPPQIEQGHQRRGSRRMSDTKSSNTPTKSSSPSRRSPRSARKQLAGAVRGMVSGPGKAEKGFMERVKAKETMAKHGTSEATPMIPISFPKHPNITNSDNNLTKPSYLMIVNNSTSQEIDTTSEFHQQIGSRDVQMMDQPPEYKEKLAARRSQLRRKQDYCVPTL